MGQEIIIVGASGLGKEVLWLAQRAGLKVQGFLVLTTLIKQFAICQFWARFPVLAVSTALILQ